MPTYITLVDYTQDGIEAIADSPARLDDARELAGSFGGEMHDFYLTMGGHDIVTVTEFPDDAAYAKWVLGVSSGGAVRSETLKAFPEEQYRDIIAELP